MPQYTYGGQKTACRFPGVEHRSSGLAASTLPAEPSQQLKKACLGPLGWQEEELQSGKVMENLESNLSPSLSFSPKRQT